MAGEQTPGARKKLGAKLRERRIMCRCSLEYVSRVSRIAADELKAIEDGRSVPSESMIDNFADVYSIGAADRLTFLNWQADAGREDEEEAPSTSSRPLSRPLADRQRGERERRIVAVSRAIANPTTQAGIFISYRRSDSDGGGMACRLYDKLVAEFGQSQVFMDVHNIELGVDFVEALERSLDQCKAEVVIIGERWLTAEDEYGARRLNDPDDYVRAEVVSALNRDIRVIPILVEGVAMPRAIDLPEPVRPLAQRNGCVISHRQFNRDSLELISTLERVLATD
jgi:transcriptional regulator with XRE-family HTH domain